MWRLMASELTPGDVEVHLYHRWHRVIAATRTEDGEIAVAFERGSAVLAPTHILAVRPAA